MGTTINLCWQAVGRWTYFVGLQHSKGVHFAFGFAIERRKLKEYSIECVVSVYANSDSIHISFFTFFPMLLDLKSIFSFISLCLLSAFSFFHFLLIICGF